MATVSSILSTRTITNITAADPAVVTSASHGLADGDRVLIAGVVGMTELNGRYFTVANKDTNTFELEGEDSTNHTAYSSAGTATAEQSAELYVRKGDRYTISVTGTFVATLVFEVSEDKQVWHHLATVRAAGLTSQTRVADVTGHYRFRMIAWTSGAATYSAADAAAIVLAFEDNQGDEVFRLVEGGIEAPGTLSVTGQTTLNGDAQLPDDGEVQLGSATGGDAVMLFSDADASNHTTVVGLDDTSQQLHITDKGAKATDWSRSAATHPEVSIHSNTTPATDYLALGNHDGTTASVDVVGGTTLALKVAGNAEVNVKADSLELPDGTVLSVLGAGTGTGDVVSRYGATATEGLELRVYEESVVPAAVETNLLNVPANSRLLSVQANVDAALTGGGTTVAWGIGTAADGDKYGFTEDLTQNAKLDFIGIGDSLTSSEQIVLTGLATGGGSDGDTALTVGTVRVRIVYLTINSLDDA